MYWCNFQIEIICRSKHKVDKNGSTYSLNVYVYLYFVFEHRFSLSSLLGSRRCRFSWTGPGCEERDFCASRPCKPWATCHSLASSFECSCDGRTGPQCLRDADPCLNHRCANSAPCLGVQGRPVCLCLTGLKGTFCTERDLCQPNPCVRGRCRQNGTRIICNCPAGFSGRFCQITTTLLSTVASPSKQKANVGKMQEQKREEFPMMFIFIGAGVGVVLLASVILSLSCALRGRRSKKAKLKSSTGPRLERSCLVRGRFEPPLNPYNDMENIYEEPEAVYSTSEAEEAPPTPMITKDGAPRMMVFVRQNSRC